MSRRSNALVPPGTALTALLAPLRWKGWSNLGLRLVSPLVLLLLWELASRTGLLPARIIAAPSAIGDTLWQMIASGELAGHLWVSLKRALSGLAIGVSLGTVLALLAGLSRRGELIIDSPCRCCARCRSWPSCRCSSSGSAWVRRRRSP